MKVITSGLVDVTVTDPNRQEIYSMKSTSFAWYDNSEIILDGDYKICVKNDEFGEKRVYINIVSFSKDKSSLKSNEIKQLNDTHTSLEVFFYLKQTKHNNLSFSSLKLNKEKC